MSTRRKYRKLRNKPNIGGRDNNKNTSNSQNTRQSIERLAHTKQQARRSSSEKSSSRKRSENKKDSSYNSKNSLPTILEIILGWYVIIKSGIGTIVSKVSGRIKRHSSKIGDKGIRNLRSSKNKGIFILVIVVLILSVVVFSSVWFFTNKNSIVIFMNGKEIGIIAKEKDFTADYIRQAAEAKLKSSLGGINIETYDTITTELVHASKKDRVLWEVALNSIYTSFNYKVEAYAIYVNDMKMAIVQTLNDAKAIEENIKRNYYQEGLKITEATFVEDVKETPEFVEPEEIITNDKAYEILTKTLDSEIIYEVKAGDVLGSIAADNAMTLEEIGKLNPDLDLGAYLQIGQQIVLKVPKPLLSVQTVERVQYMAVAPMTKQTRENPNEYKTYSKVIQQGKDGQKEVTEDVIRVNGLETERRLVEEKITVDPITEIVEVGTGQVAPKHALGSFAWPTRGRLTEYFGARHGNHSGIDIANSYGTAIYASDGGTVTRTGSYSGYGNIVIIDHGNGYETYYGHNSKVLVSVGQEVSQGELIAKMGSTGNSTGNHCHFEIHLNGVAKNPFEYLN